MQELKITLPKIHGVKKKKRKLENTLKKVKMNTQYMKIMECKKNSAQKETQYKCLSLKTPQIHSLI